MSDDGKRTEMVCTKVSERMALDLLHAAANDDRTMSDFLYRMLRAHLYGIVSRGEQAGQSTNATKVNRET